MTNLKKNIGKSFPTLKIARSLKWNTSERYPGISSLSHNESTIYRVVGIRFDLWCRTHAGVYITIGKHEFRSWWILLIPSHRTTRRSHSVVTNRFIRTSNVTSLPPATKFRQGNVFTPVCQSFCSQGECAWQGVYMAGGRGVCGRGAGCVWWGGALHGEGVGAMCVRAWQERRILQRGVCILLECILV